MSVVTGPFTWLSRLKRHWKRLVPLMLASCGLALAAPADGGMCDRIHMHPRWKLEKWQVDAKHPSGLTAEQRHAQGFPPDETEVWDGNLCLNAGITVLINLLCGTGSPTAYSNANAQLKVGDSSTAAVAT